MRPRTHMQQDFFTPLRGWRSMRMRAGRSLSALVLSGSNRRLRLVVFLVAPSVAYFLIHALRARVQANWPSFLFPALALAAAAAAANFNRTGKTAAIVRFSKRLAVPVAALMLTAGYAQAFVGIIPVGRSDPLSRLLGFGMEDVAARVDQIRIQSGGGGFVTTDYAPP